MSMTEATRPYSALDRLARKLSRVAREARHSCRSECCAYSRPLRITYDADSDDAYIHLTNEDLMPGRDGVLCDLPDGVQAMVVIDWKDGKIVGVGSADASDGKGGIRLRSCVRHTSDNDDGTVRAGIEFVSALPRT
jgi:uncharacterized protein YuzE